MGDPVRADGDDGRPAAAESCDAGMPSEPEAIAAGREAEPEVVASRDARDRNHLSAPVQHGDAAGCLQPRVENEASADANRSDKTTPSKVGMARYGVAVSAGAAGGGGDCQDGNEVAGGARHDIQRYDGMAENVTAGRADVRTSRDTGFCRCRRR